VFLQLLSSHHRFIARHQPKREQRDSGAAAAAAAATKFGRNKFQSYLLAGGGRYWPQFRIFASTSNPRPSARVDCSTPPPVYTCIYRDIMNRSANRH